MECPKCNSINLHPIGVSVSDINTIKVAKDSGYFYFFCKDCGALFKEFEFF